MACGVKHKTIDPLSPTLTHTNSCVPSPTSPEAGLIALQGALLVSRTLLTDYISRIEAHAGRHLIAQHFSRFGAGLAAFAAVALPAAAVNAGLKLFQKRIQLAFQSRLSKHLHTAYTSNRAYYAACALGGLTHADQRITEDVEKFSAAVAELYSYTFKPALDVALFTRSLATIMGYKGQLGLYFYYLASASLLRAISPPLALMTAQETGLSGALRAAHSRLAAAAEDVAFNDPPAGAAERLILDAHVDRMLAHGRLSSFQRFVQSVADGYVVKYAASVVALLVYAAPLYFAEPSARGSRDDITQNYIRSMRLLQNTARGVGDLVLAYKRVTTLAGHTSRVAELLESVDRLAAGDPATVARDLYLRNVSSSCLALSQDGDGSIADPVRETGDVVAFDGVALNAPDGTPLVRNLTFSVTPGQSVMVMGPNGSGKSSLLRVLAGLWPLVGGRVVAPAPEDIFYLSQRPYLVTGTLRDQLLYPLPPRSVWRAAPPADRVAFGLLPRGRTPTAGVDDALAACLDAVGLDYLLARGRGFDAVQPWTETLSGGEKQRLALARLLFHRPRFAVLDEATSAVSADGEADLYGAVIAAGVTVLSIAHRPALKKFHQRIVHFDGVRGAKGDKGWHVEEVRK